MSGPEQFSNLGTRVPVDIATIEQELNAFWRSASHGAGGAAVMRACSCNLVIVAQNSAEAELLPPILAKTAEWHPSRAVIAYPEGPEDLAEYKGAPHMHAWVSAQCSVPVSGGPQICSEVIMLAAQTEAVQELPDTLLSVLVPDLPVFLYWRSFNPANHELVNRLLDFAQVMIVDSHASKQDPHNRERLMELLNSTQGKAAVRDLNWSRLTMWRDLIAQFFDPPSMRHAVRDICDIEICRAIAFPGSIPTRTLLLTGWLASRLGWERLSAERTADQWISKWRSGAGEVVVRFTGSILESDEDPGISSITIKTRSGIGFSVVRDKGCSWMTARVLGRSPEAVHSVPLESMDEASLLTRELSIGGEDTAFQRALAEALALEKSFPH